jgi:hypothetical protein
MDSRCCSSSLDLCMSIVMSFVVLASVLVLTLAVFVAFSCLYLGGIPSRISPSWPSFKRALFPSSIPRHRHRRRLLRSVAKFPVAKHPVPSHRIRARTKFPMPVSSVCPPAIRPPPSSVAPLACSNEDKSTQTSLPVPAIPSGPSLPLPRVFGSVIPYPGEHGARCFDKSNVSEFLRWWNVRADDFGLTGPQKCDRVLDYCAQDVRDIVRDLDGFESEDWVALEKAMKKTFRRWDPAVTDRISNLRRLVESTSSLPSDSFSEFYLYVLQYSSLTRSMWLTPLERFDLLLRGLPESLCVPTIEFCMQNGWQCDIDDDSFDENPDMDFEKVKSFLLEKIDAKLSFASRKRRSDELLWVMGFESSSSISSSCSASVPASSSPSPSVPSGSLSMESSSNSLSSTSSSPASFVVSSSLSVPVRTSSPSSPLSAPTSPLLTSPSLPPSLASSLSTLNSALSSYLSLRSLSHTSPTVLPLAPSPSVLRFHGGHGVNKILNRCLWCDEIGHRKGGCADLVAARRAGRILLDHENKVLDAITGLRLPIRVGSGGMKSGLSKSCPRSSYVVSSHPSTSMSSSSA